jgi:hypothetical protein
MFNLFKYLVFVPIVIVSCQKDVLPDDSQTETFVKLYGGSTIDTPHDMLLDGNNIAITGTMNTTPNGAQAFLMCTDKNGNEKSWSPLLIGGTMSDAGNRVFKTADGDYIMVGTQQISALNTDLLVAKISPDGQIKWMQRFGGSQKEEGFFGIELSEGGFVVGGYTASYGNGAKDIYMLRLDDEGNVVWQSTIGFSDNEIAYDIAELNGWLYLLGSTESFGITKNILVVQAFVNSGKGYNFKYFPGTIPYEGKKLCALPDNKFVLLASGNSSNYLNCFSSDLSTTFWEFTSSENESYNTLYFNANLIYLLGSRIGTGGNDILIRQLGADGSEILSKTITSNADQSVYAAASFADGRICLTGTNSNNGFSQIFLIKKPL